MNHPRRGPKIAPRTSPTAQNPTPDEHRRMESCAKCGSRWTGLAPCHCSACHETFTSLSAFDKHRTGTHHDPQRPRRCLHPAQAGLIPIQRLHWHGWARPGERPPQ